MPTCGIIGCMSGYRSNPEKNHLFMVSRDPVIRELWYTAIKPSGLAIKSGQSVCEKYFRADEIVWQRNHVAPDGTVLGVTQYKIPRLKKGSAPSKFPRTELIKPQEDVLADKKADPIETLAAVPLGDDAVYHSATHCELTRDTSSASEAVESGLSGSTSDPVSPKSSSENATVSPPPVTFEQLMASDISMPPGWNKQAVTHENTKLIVCYISRCAKIGGKLLTLTLKEIIVKADMTLQINVLGKPVEEDLKTDVSHLRSVQKLQDLLLSLNDLNMCTGTKLFDQECRVGSAVYRDPSGIYIFGNIRSRCVHLISYLSYLYNKI